MTLTRPLSWFAVALLLATLLATLSPTPARAQTPPKSTSLRAGESQKEADPAGLGGLTKNRPKDAKTEITCTDNATFDNNAGVATFVGKVLVIDPQLRLTCDKLVVTLRKDRKGMQLAECYGNVIMVHDGDEKDGKKVKSVGRAQKVTYDPATGDIVLLVWPQIQQGINNHISTEEGARMVLNRSGTLRTDGASKTVLKDTDTTQALQ